MRAEALAAVVFGVCVAACTREPTSASQQVGITWASSGTNCQTTKAELFGGDRTRSAGTWVTLIPRNRSNQPHTTAGSWDSIFTGYGCTGSTEWDYGWFGNGFPCPTYEVHPTFSGNERHCINPGRFDGPMGVTDWTRFLVEATSGSDTYYVENQNVMNGSSNGYETDVVFWDHASFSDTVIPRVHISWTNTPTSTSWSDTQVGETSAGSGHSDTIVTTAGSNYLRIGAWDAMTNPDAGKMLMRFLWSGSDDDSASGYTNEVDETGRRLVRVHRMNPGCGTVVAMFYPGNHTGETPWKTLDIPYRVGDGCSATLTAAVSSGNGSVSSYPGSIDTRTSQSGSFAYNSSVTLFSHPDTHYHILSWSLPG